MTRPLRSVLIGDVDHYPSEFAFGVNQALTRAGHWHTSVNIRQDVGVIAKRLSEMQPDVIWGHMLLWAPGEALAPLGHGRLPSELQRAGLTLKSALLLDLCLDWRKRGAKVLIHDGDARTDTRVPIDLSPAVDLALCNHTADRSAWKIPQLHWPYFAFDQDQMADPNPDFVCDLAFAGRLSPEGIYADRTRLVMELKAKLGERMKVFPNESIAHTLYRTPELAVSARAILGYGRPDRNGWLDVRTFQYPGAGGILLSDDDGGFLTTSGSSFWFSYPAGSVDGVLEMVEWMTKWKTGWRAELRARAFQFVQQHHSATARVRQALAAVGVTL
jgi:hypothetical protein